jgi:hypothetical protein
MFGLQHSAVSLQLFAPSGWLIGHQHFSKDKGLIPSPGEY